MLESTKCVLSLSSGVLTLCMLGNISRHFVVCRCFQNIFSNFVFVNTNKSVKEMDTDQARDFVRIDLATNSLQRLSADNQRCTLRKTHHEVPLIFSFLLMVCQWQEFW